MKEQMLKGVGFEMLIGFVEDILEPGALDALLEQVSPQARKFYKAGIVKNQWYPLRFFDELELAIIKKYFNGDISHARHIGRYIMTKVRIDVHRVAFLDMQTPVDALRSLDRLWNLYNKPGRIVVEFEQVDPETGVGKSVVRITDIIFISDVHLEHVAGWAEALVLNLSSKDVRIAWKRQGKDVIFETEVG